jgi:hypothetical protein
MWSLEGVSLSVLTLSSVCSSRNVSPYKPNPDYKGKWYAPMIDNPAYKGEWAPRQISNPAWFEDLTPAKSLNKIVRSPIYRHTLLHITHFSIYRVVLVSSSGP